MITFGPSTQATQIQRDIGACAVAVDGPSATRMLGARPTPSGGNHVSLPGTLQLA